MRQVRRSRSLIIRPQAWIGLVASGFVAAGVYLSVPLPAARMAVTKTNPPHVIGAFTKAPPAPPFVPRVDCSQQACLALTFDDGPSPVVTPLVLDALARHHAHATFFVVGSHVPGNEALLRRMYKDGHEIGNHSWGHPDFTTLSPDQIQQQILQTQAAVGAAGVPAPTLFRPPYGAVNTVVKNRVALTFAMWNIDPEDWHSKDPKQIVEKVEAAAKPGRVVDLHDIHQPTADGLDQMLTDLQQNYQLVTFSEMFDLAPGQPGLFYGR